MNPEQIKAMLVKVCSDLAYIEQSKVMHSVAELPQASPEKRADSSNHSRHGGSTPVEVLTGSRHESRHRTRQSF